MRHTRTFLSSRQTHNCPNAPNGVRAVSLWPEGYAVAGVTLPREVLDRLATMTAEAGTWLVIDETYEDFLFSGQTHYCPNAPNVVHVFSFSKVFLDYLE